MAVRLRTRLFLVVAVVLGASIAVSALLSRRATLVEVRAVVDRAAIAPDAARILDRAAAAVAQLPLAELDSALAAIAEDTSRRVLVADAAGRLVAASDPVLAGANVKELSADGTFVAELDDSGTQSAIQIRGAPVRRLAGSDGRELLLLLLPSLDEDGPPLIVRSGTPLWVWTTMATAIIAVPLVFAVARRILGPVTALTDAARRMQSGQLGVRVEARGGDELAELGRAFNGMAARLAETERLRKQMVGDIAHELRSPVTNLRCTLESIQDGLVAPDRASIDALHEETRLLERLINDLHELALAEAGQLDLRAEPVELRHVLRRAVSGATRNGDHAVHLHVPESLPAVVGDSDRLEQVFRNLLSNAMTHTPAGGRIDVRAGEEGSVVRVDVADTGRGIDAAHLPHVFDRFYRADGSRSRVTGGAGLGLAIVRQLVTAHGGRVLAQSDGAGRGATFSVLLPRGS